MHTSPEAISAKPLRTAIAFLISEDSNSGDTEAN